MTSMLSAVPATLPPLRCPKCAAEMSAYERSGVVIDQCRECRGVYLDRGELERLVDTEGAVAAPGSSGVVPSMSGGVSPMGYAAPTPGAVSRGHRSDWHDHDDDWFGQRGWDDRGDGADRGDRDGRRGRSDDRRPPSRKRSFLGELLEGFGD